MPSTRQEQMQSTQQGSRENYMTGQSGRFSKPHATLKNMREGGLARALGWFSIGLGLAEVAAPKGVAKLIGIRGNRNLLRAMGLREIASGVGILTQRRPAGAVWSRVAGDAVDLALLGASYTSPKARRGRLTAATVAVAGVTALDVVCAQQLSRRPKAAYGFTSEDGSIRLRKTIAVNSSPEEIYKFWRDFQNLPRFMYHLESVQTTEGNRSHWVAKGPAGMRVEWDAEITEDRPNEMIAWRSLQGSDVENSGSVRFQRAPGGRGTMVMVDMQYSPPAGVLGATIAQLFGKEPEQQLHEDLRRFKQVMETGEIITTEGQPAGRSSSTSWRYDLTVHPQDALAGAVKQRSATAR